MISFIGALMRFGCRCTARMNEGVTGAAGCEGVGIMGCHQTHYNRFIIRVL